MSTILNALRRLEQDGPDREKTAGEGASTSPPSSPSHSATAATDPRSDPSLPATDPRAADQLRSRILAEEAAAHAGRLSHREPFSEASADALRRRLPVMVVALVLLLGVAFAGFSFFNRRSSDTPPADSLTVASTATATAPSPNPGDPAAGPALTAIARIAPAGVAEAGVEASPSVAQAPVAAASPTHSRAAPASNPPASASDPGRAIGVLPSFASQAAAPAVPIVSPSIPTEVASHTPDRVEPSRPKSSLADAAVTPTRSTVAANRSATKARTSASTRAAARPRPTESETRTPAIVSAAASVSGSEPSASSARRGTSDMRDVGVAVEQPVKSPPMSPAKAVASKPGSERPSTARKRATRPETRATSSRDVELVDRRGVADVSVVRTSWHPDSDRRSAQVRLVESDEIVTLREGDAVGGLVVQEITPSSVLFSTGDIEIRRRVGQGS